MIAGKGKGRIVARQGEGVEGRERPLWGGGWGVGEDKEAGLVAKFGGGGA